MPSVGSSITVPSGAPALYVSAAGWVTPYHVVQGSGHQCGDLAERDRMPDVHVVVGRAGGIPLRAMGFARGRLPPQRHESAMRPRRQTFVLAQVQVAHGLHAQQRGVAAELDVVGPDDAPQDEKLASVEFRKSGG